MSRIARDLCVFSATEHMITMGTSSCRIHDYWHHCRHHAERSPLFEDVCRHLAASAAAAMSMCTWCQSRVVVVFLFTFFRGPPTCQESALGGAEQAPPPGVVHWSGLARRRSRIGDHSHTFQIKGHAYARLFSHCFKPHACSRDLSGMFRYLLVCVSVLFVGVSSRESFILLTVSCFTCNLN